MTIISIRVAESNLNHNTRLSAHKQMEHLPSTIRVSQRCSKLLFRYTFLYKKNCVIGVGLEFFSSLFLSVCVAY